MVAAATAARGSASLCAGAPRRYATGFRTDIEGLRAVAVLGSSASTPRCPTWLAGGPVGVGKSHVAQALGHLAIRHGAEVRFAKTSRILADLAGGHADRTWTSRLAELVRPALLILDDFAMRELTAQQADDLYELVSERARPAGR